MVLYESGPFGLAAYSNFLFQPWANPFYDGWGNLVETRSPAPNGQDVVQYFYYDPSGRQVFASLRYFVSAYTGPAGASAYSIPDSTQNIGTTTTYTSLLSTTVTDALSHASTTSSAVVCNQQTPSGGTDSACYVQSSVVDPLGHKQSSLTDALRRRVYDQRYTGNSTTTYAIYSTTQYTYNYLGNLVQILHPGGSITSTFQYDMLGRQTGMNDPDRGTESYAYDPNGNTIQTVDARGSAGTIYAGYDGLNRQLWRNTTNTSSGAYVTYSYDSTTNGNVGVGRLTGETFAGGANNSWTGGYSYTYDQRGQDIATTLTIGGTHYTSQATYDDAGDVVTLTYPDGEVVTNGYTAQGWINGLSTSQSGTTTQLLSNAAYTSVGGAAGFITGASLGNGTYQYAATYSLLLQLTDVKFTRTSSGATLFEEGLQYDGAGNVITISTTLPQGTDQQRFCYDEQNRLTWAGSSGTPPCSGPTLTPGTLTTAQYTQTFTYDTLDRLTSGTQGAYTYGSSQHVHAVTSIGSAYTASYDASGNEICRAPTNTTTCTGSQVTGAQLSYNNEGHLSHWQNTPTNPGQTADFLYDGEGDRVAQQATSNGTTTTTVYVGAEEEVSTTGTTTTTTTYYYALGKLIALAVNGVLSYLGNDGLGSVSVALDSNGNVQASQLFSPYGLVRYSAGTMPGSYGYTGQRSTDITGLYYYGARYYDPLSGRFSSADLILDGLDRYAYVGGNPETFNDPTGERRKDPTIGDHIKQFLLGLAINGVGLLGITQGKDYRNQIPPRPPITQQGPTQQGNPIPVNTDSDTGSNTSGQGDSDQQLDTTPSPPGKTSGSGGDGKGGGKDGDGGGGDPPTPPTPQPPSTENSFNCSRFGECPNHDADAGDGWNPADWTKRINWRRFGEPMYPDADSGDGWKPKPPEQTQTTDPCATNFFSQDCMFPFENQREKEQQQWQKQHPGLPSWMNPYGDGSGHPFGLPGVEPIDVPVVG